MDDPIQDTLTDMQTQSTSNLEPEMSQPQNQDSEMSFLAHNKMALIGSVVGLILVTVGVGIVLSLGNSSKLEGMLLKRINETKVQETQTQVTGNSIIETIPETVPETVPETTQIPSENNTVPIPEETIPHGPSIIPLK